MGSVLNVSENVAASSLAQPILSHLAAPPALVVSLSFLVAFLSFATTMYNNCRLRTPCEGLEETRKFFDFSNQAISIAGFGRYCHEKAFFAPSGANSPLRSFCELALVTGLFVNWHL